MVAEVSSRGGGSTQLWIEAADEAADLAAAAAGFEPYRDLLQMRCPLPAAPSTLPVRAFTDADADAFLAVNNRAFHWHPEQGGWSLADLRERQAEPGYDASGFLVYEVDGQMLGFCWTKIHADHDPPLGEIYAIGVDPSAHGRGIGGPLTYKNAHTLREIVKTAPLEKLVLETDAPYLTPMPHRGQRNEPAYVGLVAGYLAQLREMTFE